MSDKASFDTADVDAVAAQLRHEVDAAGGKLLLTRDELWRHIRELPPSARGSVMRALAEHDLEFRGRPTGDDKPVGAFLLARRGLPKRSPRPDPAWRPPARFVDSAGNADVQGVFEWALTLDEERQDTALAWVNAHATGFRFDRI